MTPLAHAIVADSTLPAAKRRYGDAMERLRLLDDVHFFEVSAVYEAAHGLSEKVLESIQGGCHQLAFLPAPRVFLEWGALPHMNIAHREGFVLEHIGNDQASVQMVALTKDGRVFVSKDSAATFPLSGNSNFATCQVRRGGPWNEDEAVGVIQHIYALLAMINTPRVIGRTTHQPHAGLQRKIAAARSMPGKYPLHAWHELKLEVRPPRDETANEPRQTILTGGKALHFVRAHYRIQNGRLVQVSSHWKGDPALGIKQTRYRVVPQRKAA